ncbi:uracil DNA N-glycosylase Thp1 [Paramarasmius palmivorus]|uniref:Uracil DNA N-glycosylase Thp1 n=1 Tax=Paramarasmius palmivorus TaxID=297713 RepID=A0AAW0DGJ0_9AGAR
MKAKIATDEPIQDLGQDSEESDEEAETLRSFQQTLSKFTFVSPDRRGPSLKFHSVSQAVVPAPSREGGNHAQADSHPEVGGLEDARVGASPVSSSSAKKRKRVVAPRGYASPKIYAHLRPINDCLAEKLDVVFCGINPGRKSAELGHHFAHPSNHFWKCLSLSGLTNKPVPPTEDHTLPERFSLGLTNMVDRPTAEANELRDSELIAGIRPLLRKIWRHRPRFVAFVGLHTSRLVLKYATRNAPNRAALMKGFEAGLQQYKIVHRNSGPVQPSETLFYALPCTSGKVQGYQIPDKVALFEELKIDVQKIKDGSLATDHMFIWTLID